MAPETSTSPASGGGYVRERDYVASRGRYADHSWTTTQDVPSGRLRIVAYAPYRQITWSTQWQETKAASLRGLIKAIVTAIEAAAPGLVELLEEAERQAEIRRREWEAQQERWRREEDRKQIEQSIANSKAELHVAIEGWSAIMEVERFLAGVEQRAREVGGAGMDDILRRLDLARTFIGTQDPLEFFRGWRSPKERYAPRYPSE